MFCDLHVHSRHSYDGREEMAICCERAIELGITHLCFTDHIDMHPLDSGHGKYDLDAYFKDFFCVRERFADRLTVLSGLEFAEAHIYRKLFDHVRSYPFDYILGSLHWTRNHFPGMYARSGWTLQQAYGYYWEEMEKMVTYGGFDAISHFDLPKRYLKTTVFDSDQVLSILKTAVKNRLLIEINTSSLRNGVDESMPGSDILKLYQKAGGTHVMTGSDAHYLGDIGAGIWQARQQLKDLGLCSGYFQNRKLVKEEIL